MTWKLSDQDKIDIVNEYLSDTSTNTHILGKKYNVAGNSIGSLLKRRGIVLRPNSGRIQRFYTLDDSYFDHIDTEGKAYFLGLLYADGCNSENLHRFDINLQEKDGYILEKFCKELQTNKPLERRIKKNPKHKTSLSLTITSHQLSKRLAELGCIQRKSLLLEFLKPGLLSDDLMNHFVRGYFDGDGCITKFNRTGIKFNITSTNKFCLGLHNYLSRYFQLDWIFKIAKNNITTTMELNKYKQLYSLLIWMYKDASIFLTRKYNNWLIFKNRQESFNVDKLSIYDDRRKYLKYYLKVVNDKKNQLNLSSE